MSDAFAWNSELRENLSFILPFLNIYLCSLHWALWFIYRPSLYIIYIYTHTLHIYKYIYIYIYIHTYMESFNYKTILYIYLFAIIDAKWQNCQLILTLWFWFTTIWFPTSRFMYSSIYVYNSWNTNQPWILVVLLMWEVCFWKFLKHWIKFGIKVFYSK